MAGNKYSNRSRNALLSVDPRLSAVFVKVLPQMDHSVLCGHRSKEDQNLAYSRGFSKVKYPNSRHNKVPAEAVDAMPYPIIWPSHTDDWATKTRALERIYYFAGLVMATAYSDGIILRWGGDWDRDARFDDQTFNDLAHYEIYRILGE